MDNNSNWRPQTPSQGGGGGGGEAPATGDVDWRAQLVPGSRDRIISEILKILRRAFPVSGPVGLSEMEKIAARFEEKIYCTASSQSDYLNRISQKMETMVRKYCSDTENVLTSLEDLTNDVANVNIGATM